jgi:hypothetical protein
MPTIGKKQHPIDLKAGKKKAAAYRGLVICSGRAYMRFAAAGGKVYRILCFFALEVVPAASSLPLAAPGMAGVAIRCAPEPGSAANLPAGDFLSCANPDALTMAMPVRNSNARVDMDASLGKLDYRDWGAAQNYGHAPGRDGGRARCLATRMPFATAEKKQSISGVWRTGEVARERHDSAMSY